MFLHSLCLKCDYINFTHHKTDDKVSAWLGSPRLVCRTKGLSPNLLRQLERTNRRAHEHPPSLSLPARMRQLALASTRKATQSGVKTNLRQFDQQTTMACGRQMGVANRTVPEKGARSVTHAHAHTYTGGQKVAGSLTANRTYVRLSVCPAFQLSGALGFCSGLGHGYSSSSSFRLRLRSVLGRGKSTAAYRICHLLACYPTLAAVFYG